MAETRQVGRDATAFPALHPPFDALDPDELGVAERLGDRMLDAVEAAVGPETEEAASV